MIEEYNVLNLEGKPAEKKDYQSEMVKYYRKAVTVCPILDDSNIFTFPYEGTLTLKNNGIEGLIIMLESDDKDEHEILKNTSTIEGKFKIEKIV